MNETNNEILIDDNESTKHLTWFNVSKAKDGCYETQKEMAQAIYNVFEPSLERTHLIFDPFAGSGRLLMPFKKGKGQVFGVEFKESLANRLKHNITKKNSRTGNIFDYFYKIRNSFGYNNMDIIVCNPPYGLKCDLENVQGLNSLNGEFVESQTVAIDICADLVKYSGIVALIIPTSSWTNQKDSKLRNKIFSKFKIISIATVQKGFKKEYNLDLLTDIVFMQRENINYYNQQTLSDVNKFVISIDNIDELKNMIPVTLTESYFSTVGHINNSLKRIPRLDTLTHHEIIDTKLHIGAKGITGNECMLSMLDFYDATKLEHYSPVMGRPVSIKECYFSLPSIIKLGVEPVQEICDKLNINIEFSESDKVKFKKLKAKWDFEATPFYKPKAHELLAYYHYQKYQAQEDLFEEGNIIFRKGSNYMIKPTWTRKEEPVEEEEVTNTKGEKTGEVKVTSLDSGYLQLEINSEQGIREYPENDKEKIAEFLKCFKLPDIQGMAELYPERVKSWADLVAKKYDYLFSWQAEDLIRILCKKNPYVGWEMGGGKTLIGCAYAEARAYSRVLIICQGSLVENWINEANKFGFKMSAIRKHSDIWKLKKRIKNKDFQRHTTEFFVIGQEFLSLDGGKIYNEWTCERKNKDGELIHSELCTKGKCSEGHKYESQQKTCPYPGCGADYSQGWTGRYCNKCGYRPYSYGKTANGTGMKQYPAYKQLMKLFSCVITDESQNFAKRSLRGEATRTIKSKSKMMLTGTIMKNYVEDVFLNFGWLLGYENPVYYFKRSDVKRFLNEFGSYQTISKSYLSEMGNASYRKRQGGSKKLLPAVSNLNRFWKLTSPFMVRRLSEEVPELQVIQRERHDHFLDMDNEHFNLYVDYMEWAKEIIERELRKEDQEINLGIISNCLWKLRFAATFPISPKLVYERNDDIPSNYPNRKLDAKSWNKPNEVLRIATEAKLIGDKVIVFSGLRGMQAFMTKFLRENGFKTKYVGSSIQTKKRFAEIKDFENNGFDVLVTGNNVLNRGYTITGANHIIFCDREYTPEITDQGEFRCIRPGQEKDVNIHYLLSAQTIDEQMKETCDQKRKAIVSAIDKISEYADRDELMRQADYRSAPLKIARDIHKIMTPKKKTLVQVPIVNEFEDVDFDIIPPVIKKIPEVIKPISKPKKQVTAHPEFDFEF